MPKNSLQTEKTTLQVELFFTHDEHAFQAIQNSTHRQTVFVGFQQVHNACHQIVLSFGTDYKYNIGIYFYIAEDSSESGSFYNFIARFYHYKYTTRWLNLYARTQEQSALFTKFGYFQVE
jgi:hypothetical protein